MKRLILVASIGRETAEPITVDVVHGIQSVLGGLVTGLRIKDHLSYIDH